jgi:hypothetical protein
LLAAAALSLAACGAAPYVGTHDCKVIAGIAPDDPFYETCDHCQGRNCSHMDCTALPCHDDRRIVQACKADQDCKDLNESRCGKSPEEHGICTLSAKR